MINVENKLTELGFIVKRPITHGKLHRLATTSKPSKRNGWVRLFENSCSYGDWAGDIENGYFWLDNIQPLTAEQKQEWLKKKSEQEILQREIELKDRCERLEAVNKAYALTRQKKTQHAYLERKKIDFRYDFTQDMQDRLVIPMLNVHNQLVGYQFIDDAGIKMFKAGSLTKGGFYPFKPYDCKLVDLDLIFICEGVATAGSVYQALSEHLDAVNYGVVATFSAGNVKPVIDSIWQHVGRKSMIGIMDNDAAGINAYQNINILAFIVHFLDGKDANDTYLEFGKDELAKIILNELKQTGDK
jgi:phage/plasmid primase-like uncharacterized protein